MNSSEKIFSALNAILESCKKHKKDKKFKYFVPGAWTLDPMKGVKSLEEMVSSGEIIKPVEKSPYELVEKTINNILEYYKVNREKLEEEKKHIDLRTGNGGRAVNSLARVLTMYDHNRDGYIGSSSGKDITLNPDGIREMGTFAKNILALPYFKALGYNIIHLQPLTEIGTYGKKGNLGSPFAIKDPFAIDPNLADPLFEQNAEEQYRAFIEAAHALGMMVIQEVIPRTVSIDSKILEQYPQYGYWVKDGCTKRMPEYYHPEYEYETSSGKRTFPDKKSFEEWFFGEYQGKIYGCNYGIKDLIDVNKTDPEYTGFFMETPDVVKRCQETGRLIGYYYKNGTKEIDETKRAEVFPAFCDTPFEIQPFWQDVTYLRIYVDKHGDLPILNPLSFVTAKFFKDVEPEIECKYRNEPLWELITKYFDKFKNLGVDGFVLDMGHALPNDLKKGIKSVLPNVWEENLGAPFSYLAETPVLITGKVFAYGQPGYNNPAQMKYYEENPEETVKFHITNIKKIFEEVAEFDEYKGKMFGFPDNYNTKRIGQSPATRDLTIASMRAGLNIPDFTIAPVNQEKARKISLLYDTLFRIISEKEGAPFLVNPVFGTEFVATSTINVGLNTHMDESNRFFDYMSDEDKEKYAEAEKLLLMSKPDRPSGEWTNPKHFVGEIIKTNKVIEEIKPLLKENKHLEVFNTRNEEILFLSLSGGSEKLAIVSNLDLDKEHSVNLPFPVNKYYLNRPSASPEEGTGGEMIIEPACVVVFSY